MHTAVVFISLFSVFLAGVTCENKCRAKKFESDSIVCVCDKDYCDNNPLPSLPKPGNYLQITSSRDGLRFDSSVKRMKVSSNKKKAVTISINHSQRYQPITGFGAAITDSAGKNLESLSEGTQDQILKSYFTVSGLNYVYIRVPLANTDFSTHAYSYDDVAGDANLMNFNLTKEDYVYKIPVIQKAIKMSPQNIRLFAEAWTAPLWMKTNLNEYAGYLNESYYQTWANYHLKFLQAYGKENLKFWAISTGNEPLNGIFAPPDPTWMMYWNPYNQSRWLADNLGPTLKNNGFAYIKNIIVNERVAAFDTFLSDFMKNKEAGIYSDALSVHWYLDYQFNPSLLQGAHNNYNLPIYNTEACTGVLENNPVDLGNWTRGELYMADIIMDLNNWVEGWMDWNMVLDTKGGPNFVDNYVDSPIIVDAETDQFYKQPMYYALGHFSRFIVPNSLKLNTTLHNLVSENIVQVLSVKRPDNYTVTILLNKNEEDLTVTIEDNRKGRTDIFLPKKSFNTIIYNYQRPGLGQSDDDSKLISANAEVSALNTSIGGGANVGVNTNEPSVGANAGIGSSLGDKSTGAEANINASPTGLSAGVTTGGGLLGFLPDIGANINFG